MRFLPAFILAISTANAADLLPQQSFHDAGKIVQNGFVYHEEGIAEGVLYSINRRDASAWFAGSPGNVRNPKTDWFVSCKKDPIDDRKSCAVFGGQQNILMGITSGGLIMVGVGNRHYPGTSVSIRIDDQPALTTQPGKYYFANDEAIKLMEELPKAKKVVTRYMRWPEKFPIDSVWAPHGLSLALQYQSWALSKLQ
jgi:hypothetical protein